MKILTAHNFYGSLAPSGENIVYGAENDLLRTTGNKVIEFTRHSDEIRRQGIWGVLKGALSTPWNSFSHFKVSKSIKLEQPAVMHVHNTFPLLSPAIFYAAKDTSTATVLTLHNYRTICAAGIPMRKGCPCTECLDQRSVWPALKYGCYRGSRLATFPLAVSIALHRYLGTWQNHVDAFIALTEFQRDQFIKSGYPAEKIYVKPHFYPAPPAPLPWSKREQKIVYIGRLSEEKGVSILLDAWDSWGGNAAKLEIIGNGPERKSLEIRSTSSKAAGRINFMGQLSFEETQKKLASARLLVLPSLCFEGFPMVIREAFALGVPVAASRLGSIPCLVDDGRNGVLFDPGDSGDTCRCVRAVWEDTELLETLSVAVRRDFNQKYTAKANYEQLMSIYKKAISCRRKKVSVDEGQESILGYLVTSMGIAKCIDQVQGWLENKEKNKVFVCANPHSFAVAEGDLEFQQVFHRADMVTPDGSGIVLASKLLGGSIRERITGSDIFKHLNQTLDEKTGFHCFFLGSTEETLAAIKSKMANEYPNITVDTYSPPYKPEFTDEDNRLMIEAINAAKPDVLWVGMTAPKQEKWIFQNKDQLDVKFIGAIGAVFDFYVGNVKRSHPIFQRMGLEWLPRLCREPRRLFRRNFISSPKFLWMVMKQKFGITRY